MRIHNILILLLVVNGLFGVNSAANDEKSNIYKDEKFSYTLKLPESWEIESHVEKDSVLRLFGKSNDEKEAVLVYAMAIKGKMTIEVSDYKNVDKEVFKDLGKLVSTEEKEEYFITTQIEKTYIKDNVETKIAILSNGCFLYLVMWKGIDKTPTQFYKVLETFKGTSIPFLKILSNWWDDGALIVVLIIIGILFLFGLTGHLVSDGVDTKDILKKALLLAEEKGLTVNEKWHSANRKAMCKIVIPILFWCSIYTFLFARLPLKDFFLSLLLLIVPILGYFNIFIVPSDDGTDYM